MKQNEDIKQKQIKKDTKYNLYNIRIRSFPVQKHGEYPLPGYEQFRISMNKQIKKAKERGDSEKQAPEKDFKDLIRMYVLFLTSIKGLDNESIEMACRVAAFDDVARGRWLMVSPPRLQPDKKSVENIREMVLRSKNFFQKIGPVIDTGFEFGPNGYTSLISMGDGDYLTDKCIWDMKVLGRKPNPTERLQVLIYWIMGQHSGNPKLTNTVSTGIYNPRMDTSYRLDCTNLDSLLIRNIENNVICY